MESILELLIQQSLLLKIDKAIKSEIQKDTMPSCVGINKKKSISVGERTFNQLNSEKLAALKKGKANSSIRLSSLNEPWALTKSTTPRLWRLIFLQKTYLLKCLRN